MRSQTCHCEERVGWAKARTLRRAHQFRASSPSRWWARRKSAFAHHTRTALSQIAAKTLDALAGLFEVGGFGGVGNPECRPKSERRTLHHRDAFGLQQLRDEVLVVFDHLAVWRGLADGAGAGRVDIERALGPRARNALGLVEHRHHEVAALLERL